MPIRPSQQRGAPLRVQMRQIALEWPERGNEDAVCDSAPKTDGAATIALLMPTLNELYGLKATLPAIDRALVDEIVIVDGGSRDGTIEHALAEGLTVVSQIRPGLQFAVYDIARTLRADYVIEFSPDGNCPADLLPAIVAKLRQGYDLVVVSRYLDHRRSHDDHIVSAFGNWLFTRMMRPLARFPITDSLTMYRGYRRRILLEPDFAHFLKGPVLEPLVTGICGLNGLKAIEIPGDEPKRIGGVTKRSIIYNGAMVLLMILRLYLRKFTGLRL
jgi:glycosyltransferase involved in cell wall biosynthesis